MREALYRTGVILYVLWLTATVLLILGRYTPFPRYEVVRSAVITGAVLLAITGAGLLLRRGYRQVVA